MGRHVIEERVEYLLDVLLSSVNPEKVDDNLGWELAERIKAGELFNSYVQELLSKAVMLCEPDKLRRINRGKQ